ncbi:hypothetical protein Q8F82_27375, partial [Klebsiella pneumoniae]|uniref:hypothetical protein n=1 Tax=Klebsiella pneumoniae TaxID=573 RepID=UPI00273098C1
AKLGYFANCIKRHFLLPLCSPLLTVEAVCRSGDFCLFFVQKRIVEALRSVILNMNYHFHVLLQRKL